MWLEIFQARSQLPCLIETCRREEGLTQLSLGKINRLLVWMSLVSLHWERVEGFW